MSERENSPEPDALSIELAVHSLLGQLPLRRGHAELALPSPAEQAAIAETHQVYVDSWSRGRDKHSTPLVSAYYVIGQNENATKKRPEILLYKPHSLQYKPPLGVHNPEQSLFTLQVPEGLRDRFKHRGAIKKMAAIVQALSVETNSPPPAEYSAPHFEQELIRARLGLLGTTIKEFRVESTVEKILRDFGLL